MIGDIIRREVCALLMLGIHLFFGCRMGVPIEMGEEMLISGFGWDDSYRMEIASAATSEEYDGRSELESGVDGWGHTSDYERIRTALAREEAEVVSSIRLETGNANEDLYKFIWLIEGPDEIVLYTNMDSVSDGEEIARYTVSAGDYSYFLKTLENAGLWVMPSDASNCYVDDGTGFYVSAMSGKKSHQFAILSPVLEGEEGESVELDLFHNRTANISKVIDLIMHFYERIRSSG